LFITWYFSPLAVVIMSPFGALAAGALGAGWAAGLSAVGSVGLLQPSKQMAAANVRVILIVILFSESAMLEHRPASFRHARPEVKPQDPLCVLRPSAENASTRVIACLSWHPCQRNQLRKTLPSAIAALRIKITGRKARLCDRPC
jgi:hypothetical protein